MLERTKRKRIRQFHEEYEIICNQWLNDVKRQCGIQSYSPPSTDLNRLFGKYQAEVLASAIKMLSP